MPGTEWVADLTVVKLKEELKKRGQAITGKKAELVERLEEYIQQNEVGQKKGAAGYVGPGAARCSAENTAVAAQVTAGQLCKHAAFRGGARMHCAALCCGTELSKAMHSTQAEGC